MATCSFVVGSTGSGGAFGVWFKYPSHPASNTGIIDVYDAGSSSYMRFVLTTAGLLRFQYNVLGLTAGDVEVSGASTAVPTNTWIWISANCSTNGTDHVHIPYSAVKTDGTAFGNGTPLLSSLGPLATWAARLGLGAINSSGSYTAWPDTTGWELSKAVINGQGYGAPLSPPTADWGTALAPISISAGYGGYYNCTGTPGSIGTLTDDSGNGFTLTGTMTRVADGPFGV